MPKINLNVKAAQYGYSILKNIKKGMGVQEREFQKYYASEGIQFLKSHILNHGGFKLTYEVFKEFHKNPHSSNVFGSSILQGIDRIKVYKDICNIDVEKLEDEIIVRVNTYLNEDISKESINLFLLFGIRGTAITQGNSIALDLCDKSLYINEELSSPKIADLLAHEVHHVGVHKSFQKMINRGVSPDKEFKYLVIEGLLSEGMAYLYFTPWLKEESYIKPIWEENVRNIEKSIDDLYTLLESTLSDAQKDEIENKLFGDGLLGYTMGYHMVSSIKESIGNEGVLELLRSFKLFEEWYKIGK